jgi:hypothetical protein
VVKNETEKHKRETPEPTSARDCRKKNVRDRLTIGARTARKIRHMAKETRRIGAAPNENLSSAKENNQPEIQIKPNSKERGTAHINNKNRFFH